MNDLRSQWETRVDGHGDGLFADIVTTEFIEELLDEADRLREGLLEMQRCGGGCCLHCAQLIEDMLKAKP